MSLKRKVGVVNEYSGLGLINEYNEDVASAGCRSLRVALGWVVMGKGRKVGIKHAQCV